MIRRNNKRKREVRKKMRKQRKRTKGADEA